MQTRRGSRSRLSLLGENVRAARRDAALTTRELARRCEVSQPYVSQIENGRCVPSVVTLLRLAEVLDVDLKTLIDGVETASDVSLVRASEMQVFPVAGDTSGTARVLTHGRTEIEAFEFTADPGAWLGEHVVHGGSDFVYVTSGKLRVDLGAEGTHELGSGDALCYSGRVPHQWSVVSDDPATFICVVSPTAPGGVEHHSL